ncbi:hypothetical protein LCGC14_2158950, partial [marine sediment metagenome]
HHDNLDTTQELRVWKVLTRARAAIDITSEEAREKEGQTCH